MNHLQDVRTQLDCFSDQLRASNPQLYRDLALYLQVLRDGLLNTVQQACFHVCTRYYPERYCALDEGQRQALQRSLFDLVQRIRSLLTLEQLAQLAGQLARERQLLHHQRQQEWLAQLRKASDESQLQDDPAPDGSVHLDASPPVDPQLWLSEAADRLGLSLQLQLTETELPDADAHTPSPSSGDDPAAAAQFDRRSTAESMPDLERLLDHNGELMLDTPMEPASAQGLPAPWDTPVLPLDPQVLLRWLDGVERALVRRLCNLSHAINVELLRLGLASSLLPPSLLQAALDGQLEPLPAPANLLRMQLPLPPGAPGPLETVVVLLRLADLELEEPRLRTCRSRWQRQRQDIRRMAEQHRRLQRRLQRLEAERLWHQENPKPPSSQRQH